jgi:hypothetical protein
LLWKKPKPLASSAGIRLRRLTSLASISRRMPSSACSGVAPIGTSPVTTAISASKSMPKASLGHHHVVAGADEVVAAALVHQRVGVEAFGHFGCCARRAPARHG